MKNLNIFLKNCGLLLLTSTLLLLAGNGYSQVELKIYDGDKQQQLQFFCAALKLCEAYDYENIFGDRRYSNHTNSRGERIDRHDPCLKVVPYPFINALEFYAHEFEGDQRISKNQTNAFKLRDLRREMANKYQDKFQGHLDEIDLDHLISYGVVNANIQDYNFDTGQLRLSYAISDISFINGKHKINFPALSDQNQVFYAHYIAMPEDQAEKIYLHYADLKPYANAANPPFNLNTKTTFALRSSNDPKFKNQIHAVVKKVEFFIKDKEPKDLQQRLKHKDQLGEAQKIGEILFDENLYLNRFKQLYQTVQK